MKRDNHTSYQKRLLDNATCKRRFHLIYEENSQQHGHVVVKCPHCQVTLFEHENHAPVMLAREENLIHSPVGDATIIYQCEFKKK